MPTRDPRPASSKLDRLARLARAFEDADLDPRQKAGAERVGRSVSADLARSGLPTTVDTVGAAFLGAVLVSQTTGRPMPSPVVFGFGSLASSLLAGEVDVDEVPS